MTKTQITFEAREKVKKGIDTSCDAIKSTIGSCGGNAFIDNPMQPLITNDGVSIARAIKLEDPMEQMGAWLVNNTCDKTFDDVGDSTTTTATLLQAIIQEAMKRPENPISIRRSLKDCGKAVDKWIKDIAQPVKDNQIRNVATIASESEDIGQLIALVIEKAGNKTPIYIEDNTVSHETTYSIIEGLETNVGYISSNEPVIERENVVIFATDKRIGSLGEIEKVLVAFDEMKITAPVILTPDIDENVYKAFMKGKEKGLFDYVIIRAKGPELQDMASASGAVLISTTTGLEFKDVLSLHFGLAKKIIVKDRKTMIIADKTDIRQKAINSLRTQADITTNIYEKQALTRRAEALEGGIAVIKVGAPTDTERNDLKLKILNAVNTTKSALEEGIVEGGGMCLYRISNKFKGNSAGEEILRRALKEPLKCIVSNAGEDYAEVIKKLKRKKGYDATNNKMVDMFKAGIIDSAKATRCAFTNALSSASEFITTGVAISNIIEKHETIGK
jgi:chaperonin GroEL